MRNSIITACYCSQVKLHYTNEVIWQSKALFCFICPKQIMYFEILVKALITQANSHAIIIKCMHLCISLVLLTLSRATAQYCAAAAIMKPLSI